MRAGGTSGRLFDLVLPGVELLDLLVPGRFDQTRLIARGVRHHDDVRVLEPLEPFREDLAIYGGLSHPKSRELLGHLAGDTWLTGGDLRGGQYKNTISLDQLAARHIGRGTRYPSFVFSTDGGVGYNFLSVGTLARADQALAERIVATAGRLQRAAGGVW